MPPLKHVGGTFKVLHDQLVAKDIDFESLKALAIAPDLRAHAIAIWSHRVETEYRSIQIMTRFAGECLAAGDPLEIHAGAVHAIADELRHTALCASVVEALGGLPTLPDPVEEPLSAEFLALPAAARALGTAVGMLAISETLSVALIEDLHARATESAIEAVLHATLADEDDHRDYGWDYVAASLGRFDAEGRRYARMVADAALRPHEAQIQASLRTVDESEHDLARHPEPELAALGLLSPVRQALVIRETLRTKVLPRLRDLDLL